ncbi:FAD-dependent oxidoreductase [Prosthecomicrobium hirschii]|uniref:FAD-dependent oxidoreductase n=1 Tax=Prosthecodimorpha hirschii TaxID=665126 RepID=UPI00222102E4|nr:FAD-dependent oxidoreductase [Prosthecomicrobium hirschii]MCW1841602.1 FAD-dependent oxidoreductase [Prosthecomicrobium hirschii]
MRFSHPDLAPGTRIPFRFDGRDMEGLDGETIAAALSAAGVTAFRRHRDGDPRGLWCGMGTCFDCVVTVDGRAGQRACLTKIAAGMEIEGPGGEIVADRAPAGLGRTGPGDAAPRRADLAETPPERVPDLAVDVAVVGAGPAGLTVAAALAEAGLDVLVVDARPDPGGQFWKPVADSHRPARALDAQFAAGLAATGRFDRSGARRWQEATVWSAFAADELAVLHGGRHRILRPRRLVLATGAYERPVPIPGWTLPGVMTTGAAQTLARAYRVFPGRRAVVAGNGPLNFQVAADLLRSGVEIAAVVESAPAPGIANLAAAWRAARAAPGLIAQGLGYLAALKRAGVPILWGSSVIAAEGGEALTACRIATPSGERRIDADVLTLGHGFVPSSELARQLGCRQRFVDSHVGALAVETDATGRTSLETVWSIGDGAAIGGSVVAQARATLGADAILMSLDRPGLAAPAVAAARSRLARAEAFQSALWTLFRAPPFDPAGIADDTVICRCEGVRAGAIRQAIAGGGADIGTVKRLTRTGMGRCQGRNCAATAARLVAAAGGAAPEPRALFAPRPPVVPVPLAALAFEKPEWGGHRRAVPPPAHPRPDRHRPRWAMRETDVLVVGAGVVGAAVARELALAGLGVVVVDRDAPGQQASTANAGSLHVQLLSFDFGAKAEADGGPAAATLRLGNPSVALWRAIEAASGRDLDIKITGGLMVGETARDMEFLAAKARLEGEHGVETHVVGANELRDLEPALWDGLAGAALCPAEGKIDPLAGTFAVIALAQAAGAVFEADAAVLAIAREGTGWRVETAAGPVRCGRIVNCAGAWSSHVAAMAGRPIPVHGAPLQMLVTEPGPPLVSRLVAHANRHLSLKQTRLGSLLIGGGWSAGLDPATGASSSLGWAIEGNAWVATRVLPAARRFHLLRAWAGMNINIDGAPILGAMPGAPGFYNCVTSNGYTLAPIVARLTADTLLGREPALPIAPFTLDRFG